MSQCGILNRSLLTGGIARLDVGPSHEPFDVHVELLCEQSVFFNEKYSNRYEESTIETLVLDDVNPDDFADVVSWMYQGTLKGIYPQPCVPSWLRLCTIWILAQRFGMPKLQDEALDWLKSKGDVDVVIELEAVLLIYHETALGSSLRRFAVENWVTKSTSMDEFQASKHLFPHDFLVDICTILFKAMGEQSAGKGSYSGLSTMDNTPTTAAPAATMRRKGIATPMSLKSKDGQ